MTQHLPSQPDPRGEREGARLPGPELLRFPVSSGSSGSCTRSGRKFDEPLNPLGSPADTSSSMAGFPSTKGYAPASDPLQEMPVSSLFHPLGMTLEPVENTKECRNLDTGRQGMLLACSLPGCASSSGRVSGA